MKDLLGIVLAGGAGERLKPLTAVRAKPAVPFGGKYRIIDFVLNSLINSGIQNIKLLVQTLSQPLINHVSTMWPSAPVYNFFVQCIPAQKRMGEQWYKSTADAVYQNPNNIPSFFIEHAIDMKTNPARKSLSSPDLIHLPMNRVDMIAYMARYPSIRPVHSWSPKLKNKKRTRYRKLIFSLLQKENTAMSGGSSSTDKLNFGRYSFQNPATDAACAASAAMSLG